MKNQQMKKYMGYMLSFFIPMIVWLFACIFNGIYPFGNKSIMTGDITYQFIDYLAYFKTVVFENNDLSYTFSKTIGGDMAGFASYYLFSPFNFILLFFSNRMLPVGLLIIIVIKSCFMSLSFNIMLGKLYSERLSNVVFSSSYALMGYVVVYFQLYAYFDEFIFLPIIIIGINNILDDAKNKLLYIVCLFLAIAINFYIGWMICLFSALYFIYRCYLDRKGLKEVLAFIISSVSAGCLSCIILIPSLLSLRGEKNSFHLGFYRTMEMSQLFTRLYTNSFKGNISSCLPNIYCGMLISLLVIFYFMNSKIEVRKKIASGIFILFFFINFYINTLNIIWHGLNRPIGFPYRYSFLLTFLFIILAYESYINFTFENINKKIAAIFAIYIAYSVFVVIRKSEVVGKREILVDIVIITIILACIKLKSLNKLNLRTLIIILGLIQIMEIGENLNDSFNYFELEDMTTYQEYIDEIGSMINTIKANDNSFYRMEKYFRRTHNDSMQFNYNGMTHYSSCEKKEVIDYMGRLGFRNNGNWSFYNSGSTSFIDCLFGVKYILSQYDTTGKGYTRIGKSDNDYYSFENENALPLAFIASSKVEAITTKEAEDPFEIQNLMADSLNGKDNRIFTKAEPEKIEISNLSIVSDNNGTITYNKDAEDIEASITYTFIVPEDENKECFEGYISAPDIQRAEIYVCDNLYGPYFDKYNWNIIDLASKRSGKEIRIKIVPLDSELKIDNVYFYYENSKRLAGMIEDIKSNECTLEKVTSSHLKGKVNSSDDNTLVFSFPYEKEWHVYVDGVERETTKALGELLSTDIEAGEHDIELIYKPAGRIAGIILFIVGMIVTIVVNFCDKHNILCVKKKLYNL